jgi:hypothetical protein
VEGGLRLAGGLGLAEGGLGLVAGGLGLAEGGLGLVDRGLELAEGGISFATTAGAGILITGLGLGGPAFTDDEVVFVDFFAAFALAIVCALTSKVNHRPLI